MLYRLCKNGRAILLNREFNFLENKLIIELTDAEEAYTVVLKTGDKVYYRTFQNGRSELEKELIVPGVITVGIIKNAEIKPTWIGDELYAVVKDSVVVVGGNTLQYDNLLNELRLENDVLRDKLTGLASNVDKLSRHYEEIYEGYEIL